MDFVEPKGDRRRRRAHPGAAFLAESAKGDKCNAQDLSGRSISQTGGARRDSGGKARAQQKQLGEYAVIRYSPARFNVGMAGTERRWNHRPKRRRSRLLLEYCSHVWRIDEQLVPFLHQVVGAEHLRLQKDEGIC